MILLKNKAFEVKASIVLHKQLFAAYHNYRDDRSKLPRVMQEIFGAQLLMMLMARVILFGL